MCGLLAGACVVDVCFGWVQRDLEVGSGGYFRDQLRVQGLGLVVRV